ncbi:outer membrane beta-barrel protein [Polynucleobacter sp. 30F-ANTBAC]|jgi:Putative beta-barrel porin-2, OmpL-like. bbp2|uniref:outer membrane beta-barrel protein n=1 Tax=Polynucleobacter sp. 30F-ANTBAC TaxID=2689095 RepID=UPI001C0AE49B|nr:outer membrane beta-barrel protein [Polynucleobacter sp. 30F-ANTBAC]MBU3599842.1 outer membrane beta-barrel protein [Polynucleobacter sp. 30F-ANTBAC]
MNHPHFKKVAFIQLATFLLATSTMTSAQSQADTSKNTSSPFLLEETSVGKAIKETTGATVFGLLQAGYSYNDVTSSGDKKKSRSNTIAGPSDEGPQFNGMILSIEKLPEANFIPRITPLPGPMSEKYSWGFRADLHYGRDSLMSAANGIENTWHRNQGAPGIPPNANQMNYLSFPMVYAQAYAPLGLGTAITTGRFGVNLGYEIPPSWRQAPNFFYSRTYALVSQIDQIIGTQISTNLVRNQYGMVLGEFGFGKGYQLGKDNNNSNNVFGVLRWRSNDMSKFINYSFIAGDEQTDSTRSNEAMTWYPNHPIVASTGQRREQHSLVAGFAPHTQWKIAGELLYGKQEGSGDACYIVNPATCTPFTGAAYKGFNGHLTFKVSETIRYGLRYEIFKDPQGFALTPLGTPGATVQALTLGANIDLNKNIVLRPELRHDWAKTTNSGTKFFGNVPHAGPSTATDNKQTTISADLLFYF